MAEIIPKEKLSAFQRLQFTSFGPAHPSSPPASPSEPAISSPLEEVSLPPVEIPQADEPEITPVADQLDTLREIAKQEGYQAGYADGKQAAEADNRAQAEHFLAHLAQLTGAMEASLKALDQQVANTILDLSIEIARQVICGTLTVNKDSLLPVIREAISLLPLHHGHVHCQLHPEDITLLRRQMGEQLSQQGIQLVENSEITPGGCILKAGASEIDATLETRWKRVLASIGAEPQTWQDTSET